MEKRDKKHEKVTPDAEKDPGRIDRPDERPPREAAAVANEESPAAGVQPDAPKEKRPEAEALENELAEMKDRYLRLMAEFDNYRKRTSKEKESFYIIAKSETVEKLLPVYDNMERAVSNPTQDEAYKKGIEMIFQQLKNIFAQLGVTEIAAENSRFDPEKHNAVMHVEDDTREESTVVEVFQRGFEIDGRVIRHAVVKVAN